MSSVEIWYFSDVQYNISTLLVRFESWNSRYQFFQFCVIYIRRFIWEFGKYFVDLLFNVTDFKERQKSAAVFTILYIIIIVSIMFCHMQTNCFDIPTFLFSVLFWVFFWISFQNIESIFRDILYLIRWYVVQECCASQIFFLFLTWTLHANLVHYHFHWGKAQTEVSFTPIRSACTLGHGSNFCFFLNIVFFFVNKLV